MKRIIVFFVLLISTINVFSQPITFKKNFSNVRYFRAIIESGDGNYLLTYQDSLSRLNLLKIDLLANLIWQKRISNNAVSVSYANFTKDIANNFYFIGGIDDTLATLKINSNGDVIKSSKRKMPIFSTLNYMNTPAIYKLNDNSLLISYVRKDDNNQDRLIIARLDLDLNIVWEKMQDNQRWESSDITVSGNKIIVLVNGDIHILNFNGETEMVKTSPEVYFRVFPFDENSFLIYGTLKLLRMDYSGNILFEKGAPFTNNYFTLIKNNKYSEYWAFLDNFTYLDNFIYIYNEIKNTVSFKKVNAGYPYAIIQSPDGGFIYGSSRYIIKIDENGNLIGPAMLSINNLRGAFPVHSVVTILWQSNALTGKAKIEASYDNGYTWQTITENVNIEDKRFDWLTPDIIASRSLLRISSIDFPQYTSTQNSTFKIVAQNQNKNYIAVNEIKMYYNIDGEGSNTGGNSGLFWPGGESANQTLIFSEGLIWTGFVNGNLQANGTLSRTGLQSGNILNDNTPNKDSEILKAWEFRSDLDLLHFGSQKDKYVNDFLQWPISIGAPWIDKNKNGIYEPEAGDIPKIMGDEMHWMVMNDLDTTKSLKLFGSNPIGLEVHLSIFGFKDNPQLKDVLFKKYLVINKSNKKVSNMYFSYYSDNDIGGGMFDFVGSDTTLSLGFSWTATDYNEYYGFNPPAVGHLLLQGPLVKGNSTDKGLLNGYVRTGYKNLGMTAFAANYKNSPVLPHNPYLGSYRGTIEVYNLIRGLTNDGAPFINPLTNQPSHYHLSGDPETGTGWIEGVPYPQLNPPYNSGGDRRYYVTSGPFDFAPKDTQEIVIAVLAARGSSNKNSVTELKNLARKIRQLYSTDIFNEKLDEKIEFRANNKVYQNFPNPFNSNTNISFELSNPSYVSLKVFDILGREIATLVNEEKNSGRYIITFDLTSFQNQHLSSGVYFYRFTAGNISEVKKMVYLK